MEGCCLQSTASRLSRALGWIEGHGKPAPRPKAGYATFYAVSMASRPESDMLASCGPRAAMGTTDTPYAGASAALAGASWPSNTRPERFELATFGSVEACLKPDLAWLSQIGLGYMSRNDLRFAYLGTRFGTWFAGLIRGAQQFVAKASARQTSDMRSGPSRVIRLVRNALPAAPT